MKSLIKFAVGAAIAGALVNLLLKQRSRAMAQEDKAFDDSVGLRGDEPVAVEILTVAAGVVPDEGETAREDWYGSQAGDASRH